MIDADCPNRGSAIRCAVLVVLLTLAIAVEPAPVLLSDGPRQVLELGGTWEAATTTLDLAWPGPDAAWAPHRVPSQENQAWISDGGIWDAQPALSGARPSAAPAKPAAWFRRSFTLPALAGRRALLHCEQVAWRSAVRVNGREVGTSLLGMVPNVYDVTEALAEGANVLAIGATAKAGLWDAERRTYVAPIAPVMVGITGAVRLELVAPARIDSVWIRTFVARKRIEVELELVNAGPRPSTLVAQVTIRAPDGQVARTLSAPAVSLAPGEQRPVVLADDWLAPLRWSPQQPALYRAEASLRDGGAEIDRLDAGFGFREFAVRGRDFTLNGSRQVLLRNSWLHPDLVDANTIGLAMRQELAQSNCVRLHLGFINRHAIAAADQAGMMVIPEPAWFEHGVEEACFPLAQSAVWLPAVEEMLGRLVRQHRNHPSIIMWSLANEWSWNNTRSEVMAVAERVVRAVRQADPIRPLQGDGEVTWDGRLETINIHYPEGDTGTVNRTWNTSGWVIPNDFAWLQDAGLSHSWRGDFVWDRPLMLGEYHAQDGLDADDASSFMGDAVYEPARWTLQAFNGRGAQTPATGNGYIDMVRMTSDHYRAAGVACLNPWVGNNADLIPAIMVRPLDYHPSAFGGEASPRRLLVVNDGLRPWSDMHLRLALLVGGRTVWEARQPADVRPGMRLTPTVAITPPAVTRPTAGRLLVRLCWGRNGEPCELYRHEEDLWIMPRPDLAKIDAGGIALAEAGSGATLRALAGLGLELKPGANDDVALAGKRVLIVGEGAAVGTDLAAAARFAQAGGRVVVLHQTECPTFLPGQPVIDPRHAASMSWMSASAHPALVGLAEGQLRFWRPDHLVATESLLRPASGGIAVSGGRYGMHWSPLVEVRHGRGSVLFCQYLLAGRAVVEPAAAAILANLVRWAAAPARPAAPAALRLAPGVTAADCAVLGACGVVAAEGLAGTGPVLVDARTPPPAADLERLRAEVAAGGVLWLRGLDAVTAPAVAGLLPWTPGFAPLAKGLVGLARRSDDALIRGLGSADFYWARGPARSLKATARLGGPALVPPALDAMAALTEPAVLAAVPLGQGRILVDALAWDAAMPVESERVRRIVSTLASNLGAEVRVPLARRFRFSHLDLARQANRGYLDEVAGDGIGGWTDQGDNDMRYFLVNHAGRPEGGMEVAVQSFPQEVLFDGIPYRLTDPKANGGKAVITLRGGEHDPQAPAEVRGISVGGLRADRLWFLHAATWCPAGEAEAMARYEVVYADGSRAMIPVRPGHGISDWWFPRMLPGAGIAWSGRNAKSGAIAVYSMPWDNPAPDKAISVIDVVGNLGPAQLVLLGITAGSDASLGAGVVAAWDCARFADGAVASLCGGEKLTGAGAVEAVAGRPALRLLGGQNLSAALSSGPLAEGRPFAIEAEVAPLARPGGYYGGIVSAGTYLTGGVRLLLRTDLHAVVEHFAGSGEASLIGLVSRAPLTLGRFHTVRYEHDGTHGRLLIDGTEHALAECPPPAAWSGTMRIGVASGTGYHFDGAVAGIRILALHQP